MNFLFLGFGTIASHFLENYIVPKQANHAFIVSRHTPEIPTNSISLINQPALEGAEKPDVVICSWKSLDYLDRGWEFDYLKSLTSPANSKMVFLNLSSVAVYGECKYPADENADLNPINEYGFKKLEFEEFLKGIGLPNLFNLRISNVFGDDRFRDYVNLLVNSSRSADPIFIDEPDRIFRDFIDISRVTSTLFNLISKKNYYPSIDSLDINICSGESLSLLEIIEIYNSVSKIPLNYRISTAHQQNIRESRVLNSRLRTLYSLSSWNSIDEISKYFRIKQLT